MKTNKLWEILVPASNNVHKIPYSYHKQWDEKVKNISGGLTILKTAKGQWTSPTGKLFHDRMIPVRISCSESDIMKIIDLTIEHYDEQCVMAYLISEKVIFKYKNNKK